MHPFTQSFSSSTSSSVTTPSAHLASSRTPIPSDAIPSVKLHSIKKILSSSQSRSRRRNKLRIIHFIRHAEGYHNVKKDYKSPAHIDAQLTPKGIDQCKLLSSQIEQMVNDDQHFYDYDVEGYSFGGTNGSTNSGSDSSNKRNIYDIQCIISSPMRRALQTAQYSFKHTLQLVTRSDGTDTDTEEEYDNNDKKKNNNQDTAIPFVACEEWRETVNYLCDQRLSSSKLRQSFPSVNFDHIEHEHDPIWQKYEIIHGPHDMFGSRRESNDDVHLKQRAQKAWEFIGQRDESCIAVVSHSAFFMHMFTRPELGVVSYEDEEVEKLMTERPFDNCELRSVAFEIL